MKFSYSWLCDHLDTKLSPSEIADTLTNIGLELESLSDYGSYAQFVVATIVDFKKHPNADRLNICTVENGEKTFQVICGCLLYTSPSPRDLSTSRMPSSA